MVWRVNKKQFHGFGNIEEDTILQQANIFFNLHDPSYNKHDIYMLWECGVNVFNVDVTVNSEEFLNNMKKIVTDAQEYREPTYYRPIALAVTMSVKNPCLVDERIDIVILKDVTTKEDLFQFKDKYPNIKPVLIWISTYNLDDMNMLIWLSDGVILDLLDEGKVSEEYCSHLLKQCRQVQKPVICYRADIIREFWDKPKYYLLPVASNIVKQNVAGIFLENEQNTDRENNNMCVYYLVNALRFIEDLFEKKDTVFYETRAELQLPLTSPVTTALSANMLALHAKADLMIVFTAQGKSARLLSSTQPPCPVLAITRRPTTARKLHIYKKIFPLLYDQPSSLNWQEEWRSRVYFGTNFALKTRMISTGAKLVVLSPSEEDYGYCNSVQIASVPFKC